MDTKQNPILLRFPEYRMTIEKQMSKNEDFESLCDDYELCLNTLAMLEKETVSKQGKIEEYLELKKELEQEVLKYLR